MEVGRIAKVTKGCLIQLNIFTMYGKTPNEIFALSDFARMHRWYLKSFFKKPISLKQCL